MNKKQLTNSLIGALALVFSSTALAIPTLQLYTDGANYDATTETWVTGDSSFTLQALATNEGSGQGKGSVPLTDSTEVFLSIALASGVDPSAGSVSVNGVNITNYLFGIPPIGLDPTPPNNDQLAPHGIFDTNFAEYSFLLGDSCLLCVADQQPGAEDSTLKDGWVNNLAVVITGFDLVHFDLYTKTWDEDQYASIDHFAPFSHDAEYQVSEPGSLALFGISLLAMGFAARRRKFD
jgi:hypothetical protein